MQKIGSQAQDATDFVIPGMITTVQMSSNIVAEYANVPFTVVQSSLPKSLFSSSSQYQTQKIFKHTEKNEFNSSILFDPIVNTGIIRFEVLNIKDLKSVGIADESVQYARDDNPEAKGWDKIIIYQMNGQIKHIGEFQVGNGTTNNMQRIALEVNLDSDPRSLTFFIDSREQPLHVTNIPSSLRFLCHITNKEDSFKLL
ncbi:MAG: hypothetical protein EZS28_039926, partial [Streblomastix strix]